MFVSYIRKRVAIPGTNFARLRQKFETMEKRQRYSIVIRPPVGIINDVRLIKKSLEKAIGGFYGSVNAEAHITLFEFFALEGDFPKLLEEFKRLAEGSESFDIKLNGFNHFSNPNAFYIQPTEKSSRTIVKIARKLKQERNDKLMKMYLERWADGFDPPHMSIGRRLQPEWIEIAYSLFTEFEAEFHCDRITIRKFNDNRRQFDVIDELSMLGKGFASDNQLSLF